MDGFNSNEEEEEYGISERIKIWNKLFRERKRMLERERESVCLGSEGGEKQEENITVGASHKKNESWMRFIFLPCFSILVLLFISSDSLSSCLVNSWYYY